MNSTSSHYGCEFIGNVARLAFVAVCLMLGLVAGCGSGAGAGTGASGGGTSPGNTTVTLLATSTANDQFTSFAIAINSLTLTSELGKTATLISKVLSPEFIHVNGTAEPLTTVSIPQGTYTSATISVGGATVGCAGIDPSSGSVLYGYDANGQVPSANVTVNLPAPITVSGAAMSLSLDLLVSQSASLANCSADSFSITPTFAITALSLGGQPTNSASVKETGLLGLVTSVDISGNSFNVTSQETGVAWSIQSTDTTEYQGISGLSALTAGMPVDMDLSIRQDGSLLATRIAVQDKTADHISLYAGPLLLVTHIQVSAQDTEVDPIAFVLNTQAFGQLLVNANYFNFHDDVFRTSGQFANLRSLPFTASFTAANMVPGQNVSLTTHALKVAGSFPYTVADSITLQPQTINGTVEAVSSDSGFDIYTIMLPPYDLFPKMETVEGITSPLTRPNTVVVYVGNDTQMLNTTSLTVGNVLRFNGLVFNDHGTLRMDCAWVRDGVKE